MHKIINIGELQDEALVNYDRMMIEVSLKVADVSALAVSIWSLVLKELDQRGRVRLISGSYDDVGNALVERLG